MYRLPKRYAWATLFADEWLSPPAGWGGPPLRFLSALELARTSVDARRVVLLGVAGSGKTALACAIGRAAATHFDRNAMYLDAQALDAAKADRDGEAALLAVRAAEVPILVLDELGAELGRSGATALLLHERHGQQRQTIVATGLTPNEIRERYSDGVCRRLFEGSVVIRCDRDKQPTPKSAVERLPAPRRPEPLPSPRQEPAAAPRVATAASLPLVGRPPRPPVDLDARQALLRAQAAALLAAEPATPSEETGT